MRHDEEPQGHEVLAASHARAASRVRALGQMHSFVDLPARSASVSSGAVRGVGLAEEHQIIIRDD
jgi:hypothetical protein